MTVIKTPVVAIRPETVRNIMRMLMMTMTVVAEMNIMMMLLMTLKPATAMNVIMEMITMLVTVMRRMTMKRAKESSSTPFSK